MEEECKDEIIAVLTLQVLEVQWKVVRKTNKTKEKMGRIYELQPMRAQRMTKSGGTSSGDIKAGQGRGEQVEQKVLTEGE